MSRIDKYDPVDGGFRAKLGFAIASADIGKIYAVALDTSGRVVKTNATQTNIACVGVICATQTAAIGEQIDVMTHGEIANATLTSGSAMTAGTFYKAATANDGTIEAEGAPAAGTNYVRLGYTTDLDRFVVRVQRAQG